MIASGTEFLVTDTQSEARKMLEELS
jgi:hypothetical protein